MDKQTYTNMLCILQYWEFVSVVYEYQISCTNINSYKSTNLHRQIIKTYNFQREKNHCLQYYKDKNVNILFCKKMKTNDHDLLICDPRSEEEKKIMKINNRFIAALKKVISC